MYRIDGLGYLARHYGINGAIKDFEFHVSADGYNWGNPVAAGTWHLSTGGYAKETFSSVSGRYIRLTALFLTGRFLDGFHGKYKKYPRNTNQNK